MTRATTNIDQARLEHWRELCVWLEQQSYNAAYIEAIPRHLRYLLGEDRAIAAERRLLTLVFWSSGHGWRLRSHYRETLARHGVETPEPPPPPKRERPRRATLAEVRLIVNIYTSEIANRPLLPLESSEPEQRLIERGWLRILDGTVRTTNAGRAAVEDVWPDLLDALRAAHESWEQVDRRGKLLDDLGRVLRHADLNPYHVQFDAHERQRNPTWMRLSDDQIRDVCRRLQIERTTYDPDAPPSAD